MLGKKVCCFVFSLLHLAGLEPPCNYLIRLATLDRHKRSLGVSAILAEVVGVLTLS